MELKHQLAKMRGAFIRPSGMSRGRIRYTTSWFKIGIGPSALTEVIAMCWFPCGSEPVGGADNWLSSAWKPTKKNNDPMGCTHRVIVLTLG